jgi:hypothetical protein
MTLVKEGDDFLLPYGYWYPNKVIEKLKLGKQFLANSIVKDITDRPTIIGHKHIYSYIIPETLILINDCIVPYWITPIILEGYTFYEAEWF